MIKTGLAALALSAAGLAAYGGHTLMEPTMHGRSIGQSFKDGRMADLVQAACAGDAQKVTALVKVGVPVDGRGFKGATALKWALNCQSLVGMEALLKAGADPNLPGVRELDGFATILRSVTYQDSAYLELLLKYGANPNWLNSSGDTILHFAFAFSHSERPEYWGNYYALIKAGADINLAGDYGKGLGIAVTAVGAGYVSKAIELMEMGYNHRLDSLAFVVYLHGMDQSQEGYRNLGILSRMLRERGIDTEKAKARVLEHDRGVEEDAQVHEPGWTYPPRNFAFEEF